MIATLLLIIHIMVCLFLIFIVLIQSGKGAELGAAFGGSSQTLFGSRGAATFFSKLTTVAAIVFMITSLSLAVVSSSSSVMKKAPVPVTEKGAGASPIQGGVKPIQPGQQQVPQMPQQAPSQPAQK